MLEVNLQQNAPLQQKIFSGDFENGSPVLNPKARKTVDINKFCEQLSSNLSKAGYDSQYPRQITEGIIRKFEPTISGFLQPYSSSFLFWTDCRIPWPQNKLHRFYAGLEPAEKREGLCLTARGISNAVARHMNFITIGDIITGGFDDGNRANWQYASELFAKNANGIAFVLKSEKNDSDLKNRKSINSLNVWVDVERPNLMLNKHVDMIVELDLFNPEKVNSIILKSNQTKKDKNYFLEKYGLNVDINTIEPNKAVKLKFGIDKADVFGIDNSGAETEKIYDISLSRKQISFKDLNGQFSVNSERSNSKLSRVSSLDNNKKENKQIGEFKK